MAEYEARKVILKDQQGRYVVPWTGAITSINGSLPDSGGSLSLSLSQFANDAAFVTETDLAGKVNIAGARGNCAGYSDWSWVSNGATLSADSPDNMRVDCGNAAASFTLTGISGMVSTKIIWISNMSSLTLTNLAGWFGSNAPTLKTNCFLVLFFHDTSADAKLVGTW